MTHTNFLGIPVEGEITKANMRVQQLPLEEFEPIIQAVLSDETIVEFGWRQYTPYFNDGDPCVFSANGIWVRTITDVESHGEEDDTDDLDIDYGHPSLGKIEYSYHGEGYPREKRFKSYEGPDQARLERCLALNAAVKGGQFDDVLIEAFGDHAEIKVSRSGITIDYYEHN